jgi:hypothetical protein
MILLKINVRRKYGVDDHGFWIMRTFEIIGHEGFPACSSFQKLSHDRDSMQTAHQTLRQNRKNHEELQIAPPSAMLSFRT